MCSVVPARLLLCPRTSGGDCTGASEELEEVEGELSKKEEDVPTDEVRACPRAFCVGAQSWRLFACRPTAEVLPPADAQPLPPL